MFFIDGREGGYVYMSSLFFVFGLAACIRMNQVVRVVRHVAFVAY